MGAGPALPGFPSSLLCFIDYGRIFSARPKDVRSPCYNYRIISQKSLCDNRPASQGHADLNVLFLQFDAPFRLPVAYCQSNRKQKDEHDIS